MEQIHQLQNIVAQGVESRVEPTLTDIQRQQLLRYGPYWECFTGAECHYDAMQQLVGMGLCSTRRHPGSGRAHFRLSTRGKAVKANLQRNGIVTFPRLNEVGQP